MIDDKTRSLVKGLTWRVFATSDTIFLAWVFTGSITAAISIGALELVTKTILYYVHERVWVHIVRRWRKKGAKKVMKKTSVGKALTWRFLASLDTTFLAWLVTGNIIAAVSIGGVEIFTKLFFYYVHERLWSRVSWGRMRIR
jgi:uncharacterized membrane protein